MVVVVEATAMVERDTKGKERRRRRRRIKELCEHNLRDSLSLSLGISRQYTPARPPRECSVHQPGECRDLLLVLPSSPLVGCRPRDLLRSSASSSFTLSALGQTQEEVKEKKEISFSKSQPIAADVVS